MVSPRFCHTTRSLMASLLGEQIDAATLKFQAYAVSYLLLLLRLGELKADPITDLLFECPWNTEKSTWKGSVFCPSWVSLQKSRFKISSDRFQGSHRIEQIRDVRRFILVFTEAPRQILAVYKPTESCVFSFVHLSQDKNIFWTFLKLFNGKTSKKEPIWAGEQSQQTRNRLWRRCSPRGARRSRETPCWMTASFSCQVTLPWSWVSNPCQWTSW